MYSVLLFLHSLNRWFILVAMIFHIYKSYLGMKTKKAYTDTDTSLRTITTSLFHVQLLIGILLFLYSPMIKAFMSNFKEMVKIREMRFFGMEHSVVMVIAVILVTIGSVKAKRKSEDYDKFKTEVIFFSLTLLLVLISIPWPFSPLTPHRDLIRGFLN